MTVKFVICFGHCSHQFKDLKKKIAKQDSDLKSAELQINELKKSLAEREENDKKADIQKGAIIGSYKAMVAKRDAKINEQAKAMQAARDVLLGCDQTANGPAPKKFKATE